MPADSTETVVEHSARLQPSINLHAPITAFYVQLLWYPMYYPGGMNSRVSPVQWSKPHSILAPTQDSNPGGRIQSHKRWPLHYHCTLKSAAHGDVVVPSHRTDWGLRSFAVVRLAPAVGMFCLLFWGLPLSVYICLRNTWKHIYLVQRTGDRAPTFEFVSHIRPSVSARGLRDLVVLSSFNYSFTNATVIKCSSIKWINK